MTRTRYFVLGSLAVIVGGLCTGLVAYYGALPTGVLARAAGPDELQYVPADASVVAYCNVREIMTSELRQKLHTLGGNEAHGRARFEEETGIDVERDVDHVVVSLSPGTDEHKPLVIVRGRFDAVRLEAAARERGAQLLDFNGTRLLQKDDHALAFVEPGLVAVGDPAAVQRALETGAGGANVRDNAELMRLLQDVEGGSNAWAVGRFDALRSAPIPDQVASQIPAVEWFAASGRINGGISGTVRAEANDEKAAESLRQVVQGLLALVRLQAASKPEVETLLQSLQLVGDGRTVALSFTIPSEVIDVFASRQQPAP